MTKWFLLGFIVTLNSCGFFKEDPIQLVSQIDGKEYLDDMEGTMNAKKAARLILEGKKDSISYNFKLDLSDSLHTQDSIWRNRYFKALNIVLPEMDSADVVYVAANTFTYFLHYPDEFLKKLYNEAFDNSDRWNNILAYEFKIKIEPKDITINSVINLAHRYCDECCDEDKELIIQFVEMLSVSDEALLFNKNAIPTIVL